MNKEKVIERNNDGTFKRKHSEFSLNNFNDGWVDSKGRFRVYYPSHPRASKFGYIPREIVAYELYHNIRLSLGIEVHHKNKNRLDDSKENLISLSNSEHKIEHSRMDGKRVIKECRYCNNNFEINKWRLKDMYRGKYCSQKCFQLSRRKI